MNRANPTPSPTMTPTKLALIAVLAVVLVIVLIVQFSGGQSTPVAIKKRTPRSAAASGPTTADTAPVSPVHWPEFQREEVTAFNPFAIPVRLLPKQEPTVDQAQTLQSIQVGQSLQSTSAQPNTPRGVEPGPKDADEPARIRAQERKSRIKRIAATATALQQQGVGVMVSTSAGAVARIGEHEVRVGDIINGVLRVVAIGPQGIVVEETPEDSNEN